MPSLTSGTPSAWFYVLLPGQLGKGLMCLLTAVPLVPRKVPAEFAKWMGWRLYDRTSALKPFLALTEHPAICNSVSFTWACRVEIGLRWEGVHWDAGTRAIGVITRTYGGTESSSCEWNKSLRVRAVRGISVLVVWWTPFHRVVVTRSYTIRLIAITLREPLLKMLI